MDEQNQEMYELSFKRPRDYFKLSSQTQWEIDKSIGILDWDGSKMTEEERSRFNKHYE